ncbi:MAG: PKD domain-containing protein [Saprospiraceae bacterium]|nr:PKD domain-containing protein [Saprospiraceae bacterium]
MTVNIIEDGWEGCTIYKYHGVIEPFNYPVKSRWWAVNDGFTNPKYEIITLADLLPRTSEFKKAGVFSVTLNATVYQTGSMVDTCITPESDVRPVIINIVPRIVSQFECSGIDYQLRAKAVGSLYSVPFPPGATYTWYKDNTSNVLGSGEEIVIPPASLSSNFTLILIGDYGGKSCTTQTNIVLPEVFDLAFQPDIKACEGSIVEFGLQGTGADQITSYYWQFGDGSFSFAANPNKVYASDGSYTITLTVKNQYGCELILTKDINVMPNNLVATIDYSLDDCMTSNTLTCQASNGTEPYQYLWSTGQTGNPIVSGQNRFFVTVTDDNGCMTVAGPKEVMTDQIFLSELIGPTSICERTSNAYTFFRNLNPIYGYSAYYLKPGDNTKYSVGSNLDPILFSVQNYTGPITLIVEAYKTSNPNEICAFIELDITVLPKPQITLAVDTISCNPRLLKIRETSNREVTWFLEQTEISTGPFILTNTAGTYTANYISPEGCVSATSRIISPNPLLHINLEGDYTLCDSSLYDNDPLSPKLFGFIDNAGVLIPISQFKLFGDETLASFEQDLGNQQTSVQPSIVLSPLMKNKYIRLWARDNYQCEYLSEPFHFLTKPCSCEAIISSQIDIIHDKTQSGYDYYNVKGIFELPDEFEICPTDGILFGKLEIVGTVETRKLSNGKTELRAYVRQAIGACDGTDTVTLAICFEELRCESTIAVEYECIPDDPQECMIQNVGCILCHYPQYGYFTTDIRVIPSNIFGQNPGCTNLNVKVLYPGTKIAFEQNYNWAPGSTEPIISLSLPMPTIGSVLCGVVVMRVTGANCDILCNVPFCIDLSGCGLFNTGTQFLSFSNICNGSWSENELFWSFELIQTGSEEDLVFLNPLNLNNGQIIDVMFPPGNDQMGGFIANQDTTVGRFTVSYHDFLTSNDYCYNESWPLDSCSVLLFRYNNHSESFEDSWLTIVPNPVKDNFRVIYKFKQFDKMNVIRIIDTNGKEVTRLDRCNQQGEILLNSTGMANGVYTIFLQSDDIIVKSKRMIVLK